MRIAYFDCPMGVSGDMILGALIDAGLEGIRLTKALAGLNLPGFKLRWERVLKGPLDATQVTVEVNAGATSGRCLADIETLLEAADMPQDVLQGARAVFRRLAGATAEVHGLTPERVRLHELGTPDTLVDVVGALWGLKLLGVEQVYASPLPAARGWIESAQGPSFLPAPATLALLRDVTLSPAPVEGELVTPTGAALLTHLARSFGPPPAMTLRAIGYGAGRKDFSHPHVLRLWLGEVAGEAMLERLVLLETSIDDMSPQIYAHVIEELFATGARDVTLTPVQTGQNRPGTILSVLCHPEQVSRLSEIMFLQTTTLGVRRIPLTRQTLPRRFERVQTRFGVVQVKVATLPDGSRRTVPKYEDCLRLAQDAGVPLLEVIEEVRRMM
jgi:uncharacterized protein (TIGR00299 family) protein